MFHEDYEFIPDSIEIDDIDEEEDSLFLDLLDISEIEIGQLVNQKREPTILLDEGGRRLKNQLNKVWSQKDIDIELRFNNNRIKLFIRDLSDEEDRGLTRPSERSTGFRWFLSLFVTLLSESKSARKTPRVLLLDDPAVHLHPAGKRDWLNVVEQIAHDVQIVYTSHSPYLIRKRYPTRVRAFEDVATKGTQIRNEVFESDTDTLEPLRTALGVGLGDSPFISKRTVLVEGPADYYILTGVANYFEETLDRDIVNWGELSIMPVRGAPQMPGKASWLESENIEYAILLDSDEEGRSVAERIDEHWPTIDSERVVQLKKSNADSDVVIEDMFSPELYIKHFNAEFRQFSKELRVDFDEVSISRTDDAWDIDGCHYEGKRLDTVLKGVLEQQDIRDDSGEIRLRKRKIAQRLHNDLNDGSVSEEQLTDFTQLFVDLKEITT